MVNFEKKQERIQEIVSKLEGSEISIEENMKLVEEGLKLVAELKNYLDKSELKIKKIVDGKTSDFK